ncbi:MAG: hypothetical protein JKX70_04690 [Phycisphaerales bacterium]|nr:hypothetical protein [Phycisphaerales bacterium]
MNENEFKSEPSISSTSSNQIQADRACIKCGFNLYGQVVSKEPHYGLAIAICPECNTVAALQSYPTMSLWVNRYRALIGGIWIVLLIAAFVVNVMLLVEYTQSATVTAGEHLAEIIGEHYEEWARSQPGENFVPRIPITSPNYYQWVLVSQDWREEQLSSVVKQAGGYWKNINSGFAFYFIPASIFGLFTGVFWSLTLLGSSRKRAILIPVSACLIAAGWILVSRAIDSPGQDWSRNIAGQIYEPLLGPLMIFFQFVIMAISVLFARKIARFVIKLTLPPRARVPFSIFWTCDGLELPKPSIK